MKHFLLTMKNQCSLVGKQFLPLAFNHKERFSRSVSLRVLSRALYESHSLDKHLKAYY